MSSDFNKRSTGEVAAPLVENECCKCRAKLMRRKRSAERAAVVKYLREAAAKHAAQNHTNAVIRKALRSAAEDIEKGDHIP